MNRPTLLQKLKNKPHNLLLFACIVLLLLSFLGKNKSNVIDIHFHDTYLVIILAYFYWFLAMTVLFLWALYIPVKKYLYSITLTQIHVIASATLILSMALTSTYSSLNLRPRRYIDYSGWHKWYDFPALDFVFVVPFLFLLVAQVVFIVNIVAGLIKHKQMKT